MKRKMMSFTVFSTVTVTVALALTRFIPISEAKDGGYKALYDCYAALDNHSFKGAAVGAKDNYLVILAQRYTDPNTASPFVQVKSDGFLVLNAHGARVYNPKPDLSSPAWRTYFLGIELPGEGARVSQLTQVSTSGVERDYRGSGIEFSKANAATLKKLELNKNINGTIVPSVSEARTLLHVPIKRILERDKKNLGRTLKNYYELVHTNGSTFTPITNSEGRVVGGNSQRIRTEEVNPVELKENIDRLNRRLQAILACDAVGDETFRGYGQEMREILKKTIAYLESLAPKTSNESQQSNPASTLDRTSGGV